MNCEDSKQILVDNIYLRDNEYECLATIKKFSSLRKRIAVGESITSNEFDLFFPKSIGESKWKLLFYPNGQYVGEKPGGHVGIYLIMLSCENNDMTLTSRVSFRLKPQHEIQHNGFISRSNADFNYLIPSKRWIGRPEFVGKNWLNSERCTNFVVDDTIIISCLIDELCCENDFNKGERTRIQSEANSSYHDHNVFGEECTTDDDFEPKKDPDWTTVKQNKGKQNNVKKQGNNGAPKSKSSVYTIILVIFAL